MDIHISNNNKKLARGISLGGGGGKKKLAKSILNALEMVKAHLGIANSEELQLVASIMHIQDEEC